MRSERKLQRKLHDAGSHERDVMLATSPLVMLSLGWLNSDVFVTLKTFQVANDKGQLRDWESLTESGADC
jgi:hypothetical protein